MLVTTARLLYELKRELTAVGDVLKDVSAKIFYVEKAQDDDILDQSAVSTRHDAWSGIYDAEDLPPLQGEKSEGMGYR